MSMRYKGGVISATPPTTSLSSAPGIWTLEQQMQAESSGNWPIISSFEYAGSNLYSSGTPGAAFNTYTFSSVSLGTMGTTKVVVVFYDAAGSYTTISSATIGGVSATVNQVLYSGSWGQVAILVATGVSATTGNVVLNFASNINTYGGGYFATIALAKYSTTKTSFDSLQTSYGATPSVTANGNNRVKGITFAAFYSANTTDVIIPNSNLTTNYSQNVAYSIYPTYDQYSAYSGVKSSSFGISGPSGSYQALACITAY